MAAPVPGKPGYVLFLRGELVRVDILTPLADRLTRSLESLRARSANPSARMPANSSYAGPRCSWASTRRPSRRSHSSYSGTFALTQQPLATAEAAGEAFAKSVGCADQTAQCLRSVPASDLVADFGVEIPGVVDGSVLTQPIGTALARGQFARVPVINGITHDEELLFVDLVRIAVSGGTDVPVPGEPVTPDNYQSNIAAVLGVTDARAAAITAEYPLSAYPSADVAFSILVSDSQFACPALQVDRWTAARVPVYAYQFNDDHAPLGIAPSGALPLATHGTELPYLFNLPNAPFPATLTVDQQALAASMRADWASFAATGNPLTRALPWPSFGDGANVLSLVPAASTVETDFAAAHHCSFWAAG